MGNEIDKRVAAGKRGNGRKHTPAPLEKYIVTLAAAIDSVQKCEKQLEEAKMILDSLQGRLESTLVPSKAWNGGLR